MQGNSFMSTEKPSSDIGSRLNTARKALSLTQSAFASPLGIKQSHISGLEKGEREPSKTLIILIEYHYGINREWLSDGIGDMFLNSTTPVAPDLITDKINQMLVDMSEEKKRDVLKYTEEKKLLIELLAERRKGTA